MESLDSVAAAINTPGGKDCERTNDDDGNRGNMAKRIGRRRRRRERIRRRQQKRQADNVGRSKCVCLFGWRLVVRLPAFMAGHWPNRREMLLCTHRGRKRSPIIAFFPSLPPQFVVPRGRLQKAQQQTRSRRQNGSHKMRRWGHFVRGMCAGSLFLLVIVILHTHTGLPRLDGRPAGSSQFRHCPSEQVRNDDLFNKWPLESDRLTADRLASRHCSSTGTGGISTIASFPSHWPKGIGLVWWRRCCNNT